KRARAADPVAGARAYWGAYDSEEPIYNSARHALRVLYGRLEIAPYAFGFDSGGRLIRDPWCWGAPAHGTTDLLWGPYAQPWLDPVVHTREQAFALSTIERAGIILPEIGINSTIREAVAKQLVRDAASRAGV